MQSNEKKILSSLITTILIASILMLPAPYAAATNYKDLIDTISPTSGPIGVSVTVSGKAPKAIDGDYPVKIYWSSTKPETTKTEYEYGYGVPKDMNWKLLGTVDEPTKGKTVDYEVDVTVPYASNATSTKYYIIAWQDKDGDDKVDDDEWDFAEFTVEAGLSKYSGNVGDSVVVGGWDPKNKAGHIIIYWDTATEENKLAETDARSLYNGAYTATITVPETVAGTYGIIVYDEDLGTLVTYEFTLNPKIKLSPSTALVGDTITVTGTGFGSEKAVTLTLDGTELTTSPSSVKTDENGSFSSCTFVVPSGTTAGDHTVKATDEAGNEASATLTIGPAITLSPTSGPTGTIVEITGRGFTKEDVDVGGKYINISIDDTPCPLIEDITVRSDGRFSGKFVIPNVDEADTYTITAKIYKLEEVSATADFEVTGIPKITVTPTSGSPGSTVTIEGVNFTAKAGIEVTIDFGDLSEYATTETNATGGFLTSITVPSVPVSAEAYTITATDDYGVTASADFRVALTTLAISPSSGTTGTKVLLMGGGLTPLTSFNVTIDGELMIYDGTFSTNKDGNIERDTYVYVPTVPVGTHTIMVMDEEGIIATATFEVTETTEIVLTPSSAPRGYNVTFELNNFIHIAGTDITLTIYNVTADGEVDWEMDLDLAVGAINFTDKFVETDKDGCFEGWFRIPGTFAIGDYYINATDEKGLTDEVSFKVVEPTVIAYTGASEYMPGDTVAFYVKSSFKYTTEDGITINLYTPKNFQIPVPIVITTKVQDLYTGSATYQLPADADLGTWFWNITLGSVTRNDTFTVSAKPTVTALSEKVSKLKEDVSSLADTVESLRGTVSAQASDIDKLSKAVSDLKSAVSDLSDSLSTLSGDVSNVASAVSSAQSAAEEASKAATSAQSTAAGIQTAVYGAVILSLIAAVAAIMSIVIMQRKIAG